MKRRFLYIRFLALKSLISVIIFALSFSTYGFMREAQAIRASSTSFLVPVSELTSIAGRSTSTNFIHYAAGGQTATGISTSTSFKLWSGILYALFGEAATSSSSSISISGTVYSDEGVTTATSAIKLAINGSTAYATATNGSGVYTVTVTSTVSSADVITVWMDNGGGGNGAGTVVTRYSGSGDVTGLDIYKDRLITRHEDSGPLINTDIDACTKTLGSACADADLHFDVSGGALTVDNDAGLYLWGGDTFTPGGAVTLANGAASSSFGGDIKWASSTSVLNISTNALSIGGDFKNAIGGTFTTGSGQTTTFTATTTGFTIDSGSKPFGNIVFNGSGGEWSANSSTLVVGSTSTIHHLTMATGTLSNSFGTSSIIVHNGHATGTGGIISLTNSTFTHSLVGPTSTSFGSTNGAWSFYNLTFNAASTSANTYTFNQVTSGTGNNTVSNVLTIAAGTTAGVNARLNAGSRTWTLSGTGGTPFVLTNNSGTADLDSASSTFNYTGNNTGGNTTVASSTYWNLAFPANPGETFVLGGDVTTNNNFTLNGASDTFDTTGATLTVNGSYGHAAGTISGTGNIIAKSGLTIGGSAITNLTGGTFEHRVSISSLFTLQPVNIGSTTFYNLKMNNVSTTLTTTTFNVAGAGRGFTVSNDWIMGDNSSGTYAFTVGALAPTLRVNNDFTIDVNGRYNASTSITSIARDLSVFGTLNSATSTISFFDAGASSTILGTSTELTFYNLNTQTAGKALVFGTSTPSYRINGSLTLRGTASSTPVFVESNSAGVQWNINHQGTEDVEFISLKDSGCVSTSTDITITAATSTSVDRGNNDNPCWLISEGITVAGTVYSDEGITTTTSTVKLAVGSSTSYSTSTNGSGAYIFTGVSLPTAGDVLTVWMDNGGGGNGRGAVVTRYDTGDVSGLNIYKDYLIARHEDSGPLTNTNLSLCDKTTGSACSDSDLRFEVTTSTSALVVDSDWGLYLWGGDTFTPGGAVTLSAGTASSTFGGDLKWASTTSVFDIASNALSVGGDWYNQIGGTFAKGSTSTVTFTATQAGMQIAPSSSQTFANLVFNGSGGTWSATNTTSTVNGSITMTAGTVNNLMGSSRWLVRDGEASGTNGMFNFTTSTFTIQQDGAATRSFGATNSGWTFNNLVLQNISTSAGPAIFNLVSPDNVTNTISNSFTVGNSDASVFSTVVNASSSRLELAGTTGNPLVIVNTGSVVYNTSTVVYTGNNTGGNTSVNANNAYYNLILNNTSETFTPSSSMIVNNDFSILAGTLNASATTIDVNRDLAIATSGALVFSTNPTLTIARNFSNLGAFTSASSTVSFDTSATSTITSTSTLTFWSLDAQTAGKQLNFGAGQTFVVLNNLTLGGSTSSPLLIDSTASGTQWFINHQGTETIGNTISLKDSGCSATSTYISVNYVNAVDRGNNGSCWLFPSLSLTISPLSLSLSLGDSNTFTQNATNTLTVSTNATFGYNAYAYATDLLRKIAGTSTTIANWTGTNASPTAWTTTCIDSATCGFGYNTNDADLTQFDSTKYAGFTTSTPGDVVSQATATTTNEATTITYRASVDRSQEAGDYQTTIRYIVAPRF